MSNISIKTDMLTSSAVQYAAGDVVGTLMQFNYANFSPGINNQLEALRLTDLSNQNASIVFLLFDSHPDQTWFTDNAELDIHDSDLSKLIGKINLAASDYQSFEDNSFAYKDSIELPMPGNLSGNLWVAAVTGGTPTYLSTADLNIEFFFKE